MNINKSEFQDIKQGLKCIKEFEGLEIYESWFYDMWRLEEEIKEKQKLLRKVKRERKKQPVINTLSAITNEKKRLMPGYQIGISADKKSIIYCKD